MRPFLGPLSDPVFGPIQDMDRVEIVAQKRFLQFESCKTVKIDKCN